MVAPPKPLPAEQEAELAGCVERIKVRMIRTVEDAIAIGMDLVKAKKLIENRFESWCDLHFGMSRATAYRLMRIAREFADETSLTVRLAPKAFSELTVRALYELTAPGTPEQVVETVNAMVEKKMKVTAADIVELKRRAEEAEAAAEQAAGKAETAEAKAEKAVEDARKLRAKRDEIRAKKKQLESDAAALKRANASLNETVDRLHADLEAITDPPPVLTRPDLEPVWNAFIAHWRGLPTELKERFWAECKTPYAVPASAMAASDEHVQDDAALDPDPASDDEPSAYEEEHAFYKEDGAQMSFQEAGFNDDTAGRETQGHEIGEPLAEPRGSFAGRGRDPLPSKSHQVDYPDMPAFLKRN